MAFSLRPRHRAVARALAEALFAHDDGPAPAQLDTLVDALEAQLAVVSRPLRALLLFTLGFLRWLPILLLTSARPFEELELPARVRLLERMDRSHAVPLLMPLVAFKTLLSLLFYEQPAELAAMGYPGDERKRWLRLAA